jgi:undecaprenyl-diphosphatase
LAEFLALIAIQVGWAIPVGIALWIVARRSTHLVPSPTAGAEATTQADRPSWIRSVVLLAIAVLLWGLAVGLGWLITRVLAPVREVDVAISDWFGANRTDAATTLALAVDHIGDTPGIIAVILIAAPVAHGMTRRWAPALVLAVAAAGETSIFLSAQHVISRARPNIEHLAVEPATSSFPSGHVAATFVTYGCIALLALSWGRGAARFVAVGLAVALPLAVAWSRIYQGMHFPSDVLVSLTFAPLWLAACWWALRPASTGQVVTFGRAPAELDGARPRDVDAASLEAVPR